MSDTYHVTISANGKTVVDADTNALAIIYSSDDGVHAGNLMDCDGMTMFHMLLTIDQLKEHILRDNPMLKAIYGLKDLLIDKTIEIDMGAIRSMLERDDNE